MKNLIKGILLLVVLLVVGNIVIRLMPEVSGLIKIAMIVAFLFSKL